MGVLWALRCGGRGVGVVGRRGIVLVGRRGIVLAGRRKEDGEEEVEHEERGKEEVEHEERGKEDEGEGEVEHEERGLRFKVGGGFFRKESREGRDMGVLAAALYKRKKGSLRVVDAMCGCGVRALRYLAQANADFVWASDANHDTSSTVLSNLSAIPTSNWLLSHHDANRLLSHRFLLNDFYDLIDIDSFGSSSSFFASALSALRHDGLLYLTSTDGFSSGGHRPYNSLCSYGAFIRPMPYANEIGLRMLIGGALREAATRNMDVKPLFSLFSYHGPVFRVMLQVAHEKPLKNRHYGFISYCRICGDSHAFSWENMDQFFCPCFERKDKSRSLVVSGPLWIGPLHSGIEIREMLELAEEWGWTVKEKCSSTNKNADLKKLLTIMLEESTPGLPFGYIKLDEIARRGKINSPRRDVLIDTLKKKGYLASRSHVAANVIKTNCPIRDCIKMANVHVNSCSEEFPNKKNTRIPIDS